LFTAGRTSSMARFLGGRGKSRSVVSFYIKDEMAPTVIGNERAAEQLSARVFILNLCNCTSSKYRGCGRRGHRIPYFSVSSSIPHLNFKDSREC
jgi:hypothetical protein